MIKKIHGILLSVIRHNDRHNIVTLYTAEHGRISFISATGAGRSGRLRQARLAPLALVESEVNFRENRELQTLGRVSTPSPWHNLYFDPLKTPLVIFLSDFLNRLLRTSEADPPLWQFLLYSIRMLDMAEKGLANYHITFMLRMLHFTGIEPDTRLIRPGDRFDLRTAEFTPRRPAHSDCLDPADTALIPLLARMNYRNMHLFRFNVEQRRRLLRSLLQYYSLHLPLPPRLPSLDILSTLFT